MDWLNIYQNYIVPAAQGCLILLFSARFTGKSINRSHLAIFLVLFLGRYSVSVLLYSDIFDYGTAFFMLYAANRFFLGNSRPVSCVASIIAFHVLWLFTGIVNSLESLLLPYYIGQPQLLYIIIVLSALAAFLMSYLCYWFIIKRFPLRDNGQEPYIRLLLPSGLFLFAVELYIFSKNYGNTVYVPAPVEVRKHLVLLILHFLGLSTLFCTLYTYKRICAGLDAQITLASLTWETHAQKACVAEAQMRYEQTRAFRHDIKNHLSVLDGLLKKGAIDQALAYLHKLETVTNELSFPVHTGNPIVDILLRDKLELAKTLGTGTELSISLPVRCEVDDLDWCVIFANALDNAIQACRGIKSSKWIHITGEQQGDFYMLEFENTCFPGSVPKIGTGLSNIKAVSEKYGGAMSIETSGAIYRLNILLNISVPPDNHSLHYR